MGESTLLDEIFDLALSWRNDPDLLLKYVDDLASWLRITTAGDVWQPGPFPEFGRVIPGKLLQPDILIRLRALKGLATFRNDDGLSATIDLELIDEIMRGYTDAVEAARYGSERLTETQSLQRRLQEMRLEIRIWSASHERTVAVGKRCEQLRASIERFRDARIVRTDEGVSALIEGEGCSLLDYFWKSKEHVVTTEAFERLISDPDKFGKSLTTLRKRKDRLNDDFSEQGVPIEIVPLKKAALRMIRNSE